MEIYFSGTLSWIELEHQNFPIYKCVFKIAKLQHTLEYNEIFLLPFNMKVCKIV
jgi:hypothetical protein